MSYTTIANELKSIPNSYYDEIMSFINYIKFKAKKDNAENITASKNKKEEAYSSIQKILKVAPEDFDAEKELQSSINEKFGTSEK